MKKHLYLFFMFAVMFIHLSAVAKTLSLEECLNLAYKNNSRIIQAENDLEKAHKDKIRSLSILLPRLDANGSYSYGSSDVTREYEQSITDSLGNVLQTWRAKEDYDSRSDNKSASITLSQSIFNGGKNWASYSSAKENQKYYELQSELAKQIITLSVKQKYFALLKAKELLEVADSTYNQSRRYLARAIIMDSLGLVAYGDVLKAKVNLSRDRLDQITLENGVSNAKSDLAHILGLDIVKGVDILPIDEQVKREERNLQTCIANAMENRPEIKQAEISVNISKCGVRSAFGDKLPSVMATARYSWNNSESKDVLNKASTKSWDISLQANMNIFDGWGTESNIQKSKINLKNSEIALEQLKKDIILEVKQAYLNLEEAYEKISVSKEEVELAKEDLRLAEQNYQIGKVGFIDLSDAQLGLTLAKSHYIQAIYDYHLAKAVLEKAMGF